jgi:D-alanyl-D-alanine carboxypeptidase/D-alanyl-D-alanine-endopeptidase (penicillin-binding protein 4)
MRRLLLAVAAVLTLLVGYATLDVYDHAPGILTLAPPPDPVPVTTPGSAATASTVPQPRAAPAGMPLATSGAAAPVPTTAGLQAAVGGVLAGPALAGSASVAVRDAATGVHLLDVAADQPRIPASSLKLLSAAAVNATFPPGATLTTKVVLGPTPDRVFLVAGGDTLLDPGGGDPAAVSGRAGLGALTSATAEALRSNGTHAVSVSLDLSYAPGPLTAPTWSPSFQPSGITGAVTAIGLSTQRATPGHPGPSDPAAAVLSAFVGGLRWHGIQVTAGPIGAAPSGASVLASVTSAPVSDQLALALDESDNALTESLTRQAAFRAGAPTGFAETAAFVRATLSAHGVDVTGVRMVDACGLSRENVAPARVLADVMGLGTSERVPGMRDTLAQLPVAGLSGTLADRFVDAGSHVAAGVARAKTGTLTGVSAIAGTLVTADGRLLTFTVLVNGVDPGEGTLRAREALDRFTATLASCGCRG